MKEFIQKNLIVLTTCQVWIFIQSFMVTKLYHLETHHQITCKDESTTKRNLFHSVLYFESYISLIKYKSGEIFWPIFPEMGNTGTWLEKFSEICFTNSSRFSRECSRSILLAKIPCGRSDKPFWYCSSSFLKREKHFMITSHILSNPMILNRSAAAHQGAVR